MEFVGEVLHLMERQGINRAELVKRMGVSRAYITKLLRGNADITLETMVRMAMALNAEVHVALTDQKKITAHKSDTIHPR